MAMSSSADESIATGMGTKIDFDVLSCFLWMLFAFHIAACLIHCICYTLCNVEFILLMIWHSAAIINQEAGE